MGFSIPGPTTFDVRVSFGFMSFDMDIRFMVVWKSHHSSYDWVCRTGSEQIFITCYTVFWFMSLTSVYSLRLFRALVIMI